MFSRFSQPVVTMLRGRRAPGQGVSGRYRRRVRLERLEDRLLLSVAAEEQLFVYLLNRARHDPVAYQRQQELPVDLSYVEPAPPLAVNDSLFHSARYHAVEMATYNYFNHESEVTGYWPNKLARDRGYELPSWWPDDKNYIESIAGGPSTVMDSINILVVDEGIPSLGHRNHLLSIGDFNADNREIGVGYAYNPSALYRHYWVIHATRTDPSDRFLTGVVFNDRNANGRYDAYEGLSGVTVTAGGQATTTNSQGGWSVPVTDGVSTVTAAGGGFSGLASAAVVVDGGNVEVDFISGRSRPVVGFGDNESPTARDDTYYVAGETTLSVGASGVLANDHDAEGGKLSAILVKAPSHGSLTLQPDGSFTYTPQSGFAGADQVVYRAGAGQLASGEATATIVVTQSLGAIEFLELTDQRPSGGELRYQLEAFRDGILTVELTAGWRAGASMTLYRVGEGGTLQKLAVGQSRVDYGQATSHQQFALHVEGLASPADLRIANLVQVTTDGSQVAVFGTDADDVFEASAAAAFIAKVNGVRYELPQMSHIGFFGAEGSDQFTMTGSAGDESATLYPARGTVVGSHWRAELFSIPSISIRGGGGGDTAVFYDSPDNDRLVATPVYAALYNDAFLSRVTFFESVEAYATAGGIDVAKLFDSPEKDKFVATPTYAALSGPGFTIRARFFEAVHAYATAGGADAAKFYDSPDDDVFYADPIQGAVYKRGKYYNRAKYFEAVHAYATAGGNDIARLHGSDADDRLSADPTQSALFRRGQYYNRAKYFEEVYADGGDGNGDLAVLKDLVPTGRQDDWEGYWSLDGSVRNWLAHFAATQSDLLPPGKSDQGEIAGSQKAAAIDTVLRLESPQDGP